ncbi:hypothetical protein RND81_09G162000 [Saponaria officinalis]|uniref:S-protein homolog n=1 Tax=Saponaria officinalis TaxID=3572 RepID=A0AAW1IMM6_SAPOF
MKKTQVTTVTLMCLILLLSTNCRAKTHVIIVNDLGEGIELTVHCKSKDDDLGLHKLPFKELYEFSFKPNILWPATLFYCSFEWGNELRSFNIYDEKRDYQVCHDKCYWNVYKAGPCLIINDPDVTRCQDWKGNDKES